jgi:hypothetical protein
MPAAATRVELLDRIHLEYERLRETLEGLSKDELQRPGVCHEWSAKDLLAHLTEWILMFFLWHDDGLRGIQHRTPSDDLKWNQLPALNERLFLKWRRVPLSRVVRDFAAAHERIERLAATTPETRLFAPPDQEWMRRWTLARWIEANSSSHYRWARDRINRSKKSPARRAKSSGLSS